MNLKVYNFKIMIVNATIRVEKDPDYDGLSDEDIKKLEDLFNNGMVDMKKHCEENPEDCPDIEVPE